MKKKSCSRSQILVVETRCVSRPALQYPYPEPDPEVQSQILHSSFSTQDEENSGREKSLDRSGREQHFNVEASFQHQTVIVYQSFQHQTTVQPSKTNQSPPISSASHRHRRSTTSIVILPKHQYDFLPIFPTTNIMPMLCAIRTSLCFLFGPGLLFFPERQLAFAALTEHSLRTHELLLQRRLQVAENSSRRRGRSLPTFLGEGGVFRSDFGGVFGGERTAPDSCGGGGVFGGETSATCGRKVVLLMGPPGSGTTTQGRALERHTGLPYIEMDELLEVGLGRVV